MSAHTVGFQVFVFENRKRFGLIESIVNVVDVSEEVREGVMFPPDCTPLHGRSQCFAEGDIIVHGLTFIATTFCLSS